MILFFSFIFLLIQNLCQTPWLLFSSPGAFSPLLYVFILYLFHKIEQTQFSMAIPLFSLFLIHSSFYIVFTANALKSCHHTTDLAALTHYQLVLQHKTPPCSTPSHATTYRYFFLVFNGQFIINHFHNSSSLFCLRIIFLKICEDFKFQPW